jgi:hypothetical protein
VEEAHYHVRHLDARVVDVVLHADVVAPVTQQAHERVAQAGVPEVADVGGLVGVDARVLDDHVARPLGHLAPGQGARELASERSAVEEEVHVSPAGHRAPSDARGRRELLRQALGDLAGRTVELLGEVEGGGQGEVPELNPGRVLEGDILEFDVEGRPSCAPRRVGETPLSIQDHNE